MSLAIQSAKAQGDPGLFGFLGKAVGTVAKVATSFIPGPAGAVARYATGKIFGAGPAPTSRALPAVKSLPSIFTNTTFGARPTPTVRDAMAEETYQTQPQQLQLENGGAAGVKIACPQGYKPNKSGYYRTTNGQVHYVEPGSRCVKVRKRNAANPRAADRAISRIESAKRFAKRMSRVTVRKKCDCS